MVILAERLEDAIGLARKNENDPAQLALSAYAQRLNNEAGAFQRI